MKLGLRVMAMVLCLATVSVVSGKGKKDPAALIAGTYEGKAFVEIMQQEMPLKLQLVRTYKDSVQVKVVDFALPTGQKFSYQSKNFSIKTETKEGKKSYKLALSFLYNYNNMPMRVEATGTIVGDNLDAEVKATIMESMQTKVTYKAKRTI